MRRKKTVPLDLTVKVATALPLCHRLGFPCIACGSPVDLEQAYCPVCRVQAFVLDIETYEARGPRSAVYLREDVAA